jgi:hypothetical protein
MLHTIFFFFFFFFFFIFLRYATFNIKEVVGRSLNQSIGVISRLKHMRWPIHSKLNLSTSNHFTVVRLPREATKNLFYKKKKKKKRVKVF